MLYVSLTVWAILIICIFFEYIALTRYKKLNKDNKSYLATITHDLKNPASAQINMLNMLLNGKFGHLNSEQYEMIKLTQNSSKYISNLVGTILTDYECDSKIIKLNKTQFDLVELVDKICEENKSLYLDKNQILVFNHRNMDKCFIEGDKLQMARVIYNLLSNAVTYSNVGAKIDIFLYRYKNCVNFSIKNKSIPVSNKELKNIFNKFSKTKISRINKNSTGLGLYVSKRIIELHKGKIYAHCNSNGIYTFGFSISSKIKTKKAINN